MVFDQQQLIDKQMRRLLGSPLLKYNYLTNFKKPVVEIPTTKPPKYIYQIVYHPAAMPDLDMKFQDHGHFNDWLTIVYGEQDKHEFQYSGQWWEAVSVSGRAVLLAVTLIIIATMHSSADERKSKHLPGLLSHYNVSDVATNHLPTIIEN